MKVLKRAGLPPHHLLHYYVAVIRPVLEYCSCIWHHNITNKLSLQIQAIQKRAIKIIGCDSDVTHVHQAEGVYGSPDYDIARCAHRPDLSNVARSSHKQFFMSTLPKPISLPVIWLANLRGGLVNKLDEIASILLANNVHIAAITESWLHQGIDSQLTQISGYVSHRQDRPDCRSGGGIIVFVKGRLPCVPVPWLHNSSFEVMWFSFRASRMPRGVTHLLVGVVYHPPAANNFAMNEYLVSSIDEFTRRHPGCGVLILGDFNRLPEGSLRAYPLTQVVSKPTREHAILDKMFTNVSSWYTDPVILPAVMNSDHFSVIYSPKHCPPRTKGQYRSDYRRSTDPNAKAMLCYALQRFNLDTSLPNELDSHPGSLLLYNPDRPVGPVLTVHKGHKIHC